MVNELNEILANGDWWAEDTSVLETCCGDSVELDCARCPTCGRPNPLFEQGLI